MNKLNFGCGSIQPEGWYNVDQDPSFQQNKPGTPFTLQSTEKFSDGFFDIIVAHAVIQQIEWHELVKQLKDLHRLLKAGGVLRISLPDIKEGFSRYKEGDLSWFPNGEENLADRFSAWLTWYSTSKTLLTEGALINKLKEAGFSDVGICDFKKSCVFNNEENPEIVTLDTRENEFFFVEATR